MEKIKDFLTAKTPITDTIDVPNFLFVAMVIVLLLLIIIIISAVKNNKKEKVKSDCFTENNDIIPFLDSEKPIEESLNVETSEDNAPNFNKEVLATDNAATKDTVEILEPKESRRGKLAFKVDTATASGPILETTKITPINDMKVPVEQPLVDTIVKEDKASVIKEVAVDAKEEIAKESDSKVGGKFEICNSNIGGFRYLLSANNGQLLYESRDYKTVRACTDALDKFKIAVNADSFTVKADKFNRFKFTLKSPTSNSLIYVGESFATKAACLSNIESVKRFASNSQINDITQEGFVAKGKAYVIPEDVKLSVSNPNGVTGKWEIAKDEDGDKPTYSFLLYANNGQLLYESRDYASASSCKNGVETFIKTVKEGEFIIDPDKAGRFKFLLRNPNSSSLMEYIGQNYTTNKAASNSADSVYKFALVSPTDNL